MRETDVADERSAGPPWIRGFQFVRVVAAFTVVALHLGWVAHAPTSVARLVYPVEWFFVLSGFLTVQQTMTRDGAGWRTSSSAYLRRRILRVVPAYVVFVVVASAVAATTAVVVRWPSLKLAAIFSYDLARRTEASPVFDHLWSIGVEVKFYLLSALLIWLVGPRLATRVSMALCLGCLVVLWVLPSIGMAEQWRSPRRIFIPAVGAICLGQIVATLARSRRLRVRTILESSWILCAAVPLLLTPLVATTHAAVALGGHFCGIALVVQWIASHQRNRVVVAIDVRAVRWLGDLSYSIYLWQGLFLTTGPAGATDWFQRWPVNVLLILPAAAASYYLVERPFLRERNPTLARDSPT